MPANTNIELFRELPVRNSLAESIIWNHQTQTLWWTDIHAKKIYCSPWPFNETQSWATPERLCSFGFTQDPEKLVAAFESGFAFYFPRTQQLDWIARPEQTFFGTRFNDGRVDRQGRFWSGTLVEKPDAKNANGEPTLGSIYCLNGKNCTQEIPNIKATNSLCWSLDGNTLYYTDSPTREIRQLNLKEKNSQAKTFITTPEEIYPDGSIVDAHGYLWNAQWLGGKVVRYTPNGAIETEIKIPASQVTCICFAGPELDYLCVSTATEDYTEEQLKAEPQAGNIFIFKTRWKGVQECFFNE